MNRSESQANNRAIDSLINYETVKYCGNEEHEVARYDECMGRYQVRLGSACVRVLCCVFRGQGYVPRAGMRAWVCCCVLCVT